jgi:hypothetical protein
MNRPASSLLCGLVYLLTGPGAARAGQMAADTVALIVEYLDASDKVVLRIPFYGTSTDEN